MLYFEQAQIKVSHICTFSLQTTVVTLLSTKQTRKLSPPDHHVVEREAKVRAWRQNFGHPDLDLYLLLISLPHTLKNHLQVITISCKNLVCEEKIWRNTFQNAFNLSNGINEIRTSSSFTGRYRMEPSKATTSPVVGRCSFIMPKRIPIDSTFGLKKRSFEITISS